MNNDTRTNATKCEPTIPDPPPGAPHNTCEVLGDPGGGEGGGGGRRLSTRRNGHARDAAGEPTIPDPPPGAPHDTCEVLGDPGGGEGGGGGRRLNSRRNGHARDAAGEELKEGAREDGQKFWRSWEPSDLGDTVSKLRRGVIGAHAETLKREIPLDNIPSSNLHYFVKKQPHSSHECFPAVDIRIRSGPFVRERPPAVVVIPPSDSVTDEMRVKKAEEMVGQFNRLSRQKKGGTFDVEIIGSSGFCPFCEDLKGVCLGPNCLKKGKDYIHLTSRLIYN